MGKMPEDGCHGEAEWVTGVVTPCCPVMYQAEYSALFTAFLWSKRGCLPFTGGWLEQPAAVIAGLDVIYRVAAEYEQERIEAGNT